MQQLTFYIIDRLPDPYCVLIFTTILECVMYGITKLYIFYRLMSWAKMECNV